MKKKKINIKLFFKNGKRKRKYIFKKKFTYSPNPILYDSYPRYIPNTGSFIMINGENLENEPNKINCFLDELVFSGKLISNNKLLCNITELKILKYSPYKISISLNGFKVYAQDLFVSFYGLNRIDPNKGPFKTKIEVQ